MNGLVSISETFGVTSIPTYKRTVESCLTTWQLEGAESGEEKAGTKKQVNASEAEEGEVETELQSASSSPKNGG